MKSQYAERYGARAKLERSNEVKALMKLKDHPNIVKLLDQGGISNLELQQTAERILVANYIALENCGYNMYEIIKEGGRFDEKTARDLFNQMLNGIEHMHQNSVYHGDIRLENILIDEQENLKFIDFGQSTFKRVEKIDEPHMEN